MFKQSTNKKISVALGFLTAAAAAVLILGDTWGFAPLAKQIFASITGVAAIVNVYFLGSTAEKINKGVK